MGKLPTFPTLYNDVLKLDISRLRQKGYLKPGPIESYIWHWSQQGERVASITIKIDNQGKTPSIELSYKYEGETRRYKVHFEKVPSNLKRGEVWYFICPLTKKRCRKLYSINGYFLHREAFKGCMYEVQTRSRKVRQLIGAFEIFSKMEILEENILKKHAKKTYAGKPTKKYQKLLDHIEQLDENCLKMLVRETMI